MGNPSERAVKMLGDIYINCSVCGKSTHPGSLYVIDGWPVCVDCDDKAADAEVVEDEIFTECACCGGLIGERDWRAYYGGRSYCSNCSDNEG